MKVSNYLDTKHVEELPGVVKREVISAEDGAPRFCMLVFEVQSGSSTIPHTHWWGSREKFKWLRIALFLSLRMSITTLLIMVTNHFAMFYSIY